MRGQLVVVLLGAVVAVNGVGGVPAPAAAAERLAAQPFASGAAARLPSPLAPAMSRRGLLPFLSKDKIELALPAASGTAPPEEPKNAPAPAAPPPPLPTPQTPPPPPPPPSPSPSPSNPQPSPTVPAGSTPSADAPPPKTSPAPTNPKDDAASSDSPASPAPGTAAVGGAGAPPGSTPAKSGMSSSTIYGVVLGGVAALVVLLAFVHRWKSARERHMRTAALPPVPYKPSPEFRLKPKDEQAEKVVGSTLPRAHNAATARVVAFAPVPASASRASYAAAPFAYGDSPPSSPFRPRPGVAPAALAVRNEADQVQFRGEGDAPADYLLDRGAAPPSSSPPANRLVSPREYAGGAAAPRGVGDAYGGLYAPQRATARLTAARCWARAVTDIRRQGPGLTSERAAAPGPSFPPSSFLIARKGRAPRDRDRGRRNGQSCAPARNGERERAPRRADSTRPRRQCIASHAHYVGHAGPYLSPLGHRGPVGTEANLFSGNAPNREQHPNPTVQQIAGDAGSLHHASVNKLNRSITGISGRGFLPTLRKKCGSPYPPRLTASVTRGCCRCLNSCAGEIGRDEEWV
ncbi:MAG: hypothetical protein BJ554DRAFT_4025 [Olpidium bornovanus]|uniref:Uncharacterized protein n=1 Tax=Olpidium bornovanus TaxID=278681 RepID=A0A8H8A120_9FUNG|nr:MAG: hypothetical protein BJ554DRAFT_4025 [Olpidium bornovanus]